jgi:hypothetical protein
MNERDYFEDTGVDRRMALTLIFDSYNKRA